MIGLLGMGLGLYGIYELSKNVKATKQDANIKSIGTIQQQKRNIDNHFNDILEYCGVKNPHNIEQHHYDKIKYYLTQKGYSYDATQYCLNKVQLLMNTNHHRQERQNNNIINKFEQSLVTDKSREVNVFFTMYGCISRNKIEKDLNKVIQYLHTHNNENARVNIIETPSDFKSSFDVTWTIKAPYKCNPNEYIECVEKKLNILW